MMKGGQSKGKKYILKKDLEGQLPYGKPHDDCAQYVFGLKFVSPFNKSTDLPQNSIFAFQF